MTSVYRLLYSPESIDDLRMTHAAILRASGSDKAARRTVERIRASIRTLKSMPARHETPDWEPWRSRGVRRVIVGNYTVLYLVDEAEHVVEILRVFIGAPRLGTH